MSLHVSKITLGLVAAGACFSAQAGLKLRLDGFTVPGPDTVSVSVKKPSAASTTTAAGQFQGTLDGASFQTYCTDLLQPFEFGTSYTYTLVGGAAAWGATKAEDLGRLMTYVSATPRWATESAMIQSAVWEILYETSRDYGFTTGNIKTSAKSGDMTSWLNALDWTAVKNTTSIYNVDQLYNGATQDFMLVTKIAQPVPEPSTYALLLGGLGFVGFMARRRAAKA
jgi:hypothetical protein